MGRDCHRQSEHELTLRRYSINTLRKSKFDSRADALHKQKKTKHYIFALLECRGFMYFILTENKLLLS